MADGGITSPCAKGGLHRCSFDAKANRVDTQNEDLGSDAAITAAIASIDTVVLIASCTLTEAVVRSTCRQGAEPLAFDGRGKSVTKKIVAIILLLASVAPALSADIPASKRFLTKHGYFAAHVCRGELDWRCSKDFNWPVGSYTHIACHVPQSDQSIADGICGGRHGNIVYLKQGADGNNCGYDWWDVYC